MLSTESAPTKASAAAASTSTNWAPRDGLP